MRKVQMVKLLALLLVLALFGEKPSQAQEKSAPVHVILITIDTLSANYLSLYGYKHKTTPFLDSLRKEGVLFNNAYTLATQSAPSHASILTSVHPATLGMYKNGIPLEQRWKTLAEILKEHDYINWAWVNAHAMSAPVTNFNQGYDRFHTVSELEKVHSRAKPVSRILSESSAKLREAAKKYPGKPLHFWFHFNFAHSPYRYPKIKRFKSMYRVTGEKQLKVKQIKAIHMKQRLPSDIELSVLEARYLRSIHYIDETLRELFTVLSETSIRNNSIVAIVADHGETFQIGSPGGHSGVLLDDVLHIPMMLLFPGNEFAGRSINHLVDQRDILPTILHQLTIPVPTQTQGRSLLPMIEGDRVWKEHFVATIASPFALFTARNMEWKYIEAGQKGGLKNHLDVFPFLPSAVTSYIGESHAQNIEAPAAVQDRLTSVVTSLRNNLGSRSNSQISNQAIEALRISGYLNPD